MEENTILMEQNRYSQSKVYKLIDINTQHFYIGSTTSQLSQRLYWHKKHPQGNIQRHVQEHGFNFIIRLIKEFNLNSKIYLLREEDIIIQQNLNNEKCLNINRAYLTEEEKRVKEHDRCRMYKIGHKEEVSEYNKEYYIQNMTHVKQKKHENGILPYTCECGMTVRKYCKASHLKSKKHAELMQTMKGV